MMTSDLTWEKLQTTHFCCLSYETAFLKNYWEQYPSRHFKEHKIIIRFNLSSSLVQQYSFHDRLRDHKKTATTTQIAQAAKTHVSHVISWHFGTVFFSLIFPASAHLRRNANGIRLQIKGKNMSSPVNKLAVPRISRKSEMFQFRLRIKSCRFYGNRSNVTLDRVQTVSYS